MKTIEEHREYMREAQRKYRARHPNRVKAYEQNNKHKAVKRARKWAALNPEKRKASYLKYYYKNKAKCVAQNRIWKLSNPERWRELQRIWKSVNLERWRELQRVGAKNRRARKTGAEGRITRQDVTELLDLQGGFCAAEHCRASLGGRFHVDHIIPLSKNGTNKRDNVQLLCPSCNLSKNNKTMEEWMGLKRMLI